jgi:hypothetical protein
MQGGRKGEKQSRAGVWQVNKQGKQSNVELLIPLSRREGRIRQAGGNCGGGRNSGVQCWQPVGDVALGWGAGSRELERWVSRGATRGPGGKQRRWPAMTRSGALRRRQEHQGSRAGGGAETPGGRRGKN